MTHTLRSASCPRTSANGVVRQQGNGLIRIGQTLSKLAVGFTLLGAIDVLNHSSVGAAHRQQEQVVLESPSTQALRAARESATSVLQEGICVGAGRFTFTVSSSKVSVSWLLAL